MIRLFLFCLMIVSLQIVSQEKPRLSDVTQTCIDCHEMVTPGIVHDWETSKHSKMNLSSALAKRKLEKRVSIENLPENFDAEIVIGCYECHSQNYENHKDSFDHFGYEINVIVSPNDCKTCHPLEVEEYTESKKGYAVNNLYSNPLYQTLVETVTSVKKIENDEIVKLESSRLTQGETCYACHGTIIEVDGLKLVNSILGEIEVPNLQNWPNQGVGRINPDGSRGACTSCHPRHGFSIEVARKPYTCGQCHLEPDVPAYNVYKESKHGNLFESNKEKYNWHNVPWEIGKDFRSPTCASCHNSLLIDSQGTVVAERTHDFGSRLWVRIFGLIYSHPQPKSGATYEIRNEDNIPMPTTFKNVPASDFLISADDQIERRKMMQKVCTNCHGTSWSELQLAKIDKVNKETDAMVLAATQLMEEAWEKGFENPQNPFDEQLEILWQRQWLFYANSVRYGTAMMGPDYSAFKNGWWEMSQNLSRMHSIIKTMSPN